MRDAKNAVTAVAKINGNAIGDGNNRKKIRVLSDQAVALLLKSVGRVFYVVHDF